MQYICQTIVLPMVRMMLHLVSVFLKLEAAAAPAPASAAASVEFA